MNPADIETPRGSKLVEAMRENVHEAQRAWEHARAAYQRGRTDGIIVTDATTHEVRGTDEAGLGAKLISLLRVARSDVDHWDEYLTWALQTTQGPQADPRSALPRPAPASPTPDPRLPPEKDDEEASVPF